jgi:hypothetical protein
MTTGHILNAIKYLSRHGYISLSDYKVGMILYTTLNGDGAQHAIESVLFNSTPTKWVDVLKSELKKREAAA